jgi:hypothetical protein
VGVARDDFNSGRVHLPMGMAKGNETMKDPQLLRTVLNDGGPPRLILELHAPDHDGDEPVAVIVERDPRLSSFTIANMLMALLKEYTASAERHRLQLASKILHEGKVQLSEGIEEALLDTPTRWSRLEYRDDDERGA